MNSSLANYPLLLLLLTVGGGVAALLRWFANRVLAQMEARLARIEALEERFERHLAELPLHYQRRDDAIRENTTINFKLDRLYELLYTRLLTHDGKEKPHD